MQGERKESRIERFTNWIVESIGQLAQLILLMAVAYAAYKVSPGHADNVLLDQIWIISQMVALDVSAPGLARIAKQERKIGNEERANQLKNIAITLLIMGILTGAEVATFSFFPHFPEELRNIISWALMIGRVATALLYMYALHSGGKEGKSLIEQMQELAASYEQRLQDLIHRHEKQSLELTRQNKELIAQQKIQEARAKELEDRYTKTLDLQQQQSRQYVKLYDRYQTLEHSHNLLLSDHTNLKTQHTDLASTHQTLVSQYTDVLTHSQEIEKQVMALTEERDSLKNILSVISAKQVSRQEQKQVSQPQEKVSQIPVKKASHSTRNDSVKVSQTNSSEEREARLQEALQELVNDGERVSSRTLSEKTGYNRNITNDWLRTQNVTPQNDSKNEKGQTVTEKESDTEEHRVIQIEKYKDVTA